jgi:hypothetical protein
VLLCERVLCVYVCILVSALVVNSGSPFIVSRGRQVFYKSRFLLLDGETPVLTLLKLVHLVLGGWSAVWLFLWSVAEPCRSRGGRGAVTVNSGK